MTFSRSGPTPAQLVVVAHGPAGPVRELLQQAAPALAAALALPWAGCLAPNAPSATLAALPAGLTALPIDPGQSLAAGEPWVEVLGAWRQPVLVLLTAEQVGWGLALASAALLAQRRVPLVGLVQWGEPWAAELRRREGLPWLGWLDSRPQGGDPAAAAGLAAALRLRWQRLASDQG